MLDLKVELSDVFIFLMVAFSADLKALSLSVGLPSFCPWVHLLQVKLLIELLMLLQEVPSQNLHSI